MLTVVVINGLQVDFQLQVEETKVWQQLFVNLVLPDLQSQLRDKQHLGDDVLTKIELFIGSPSSPFTRPGKLRRPNADSDHY